jgi:hypothetical protein
MGAMDTTKVYLCLKMSQGNTDFWIINTH